LGKRKGMAQVKTKKTAIVTNPYKGYVALEELQKKYPDSWVLLENPKPNPQNSKIIGGVFHYKHKNREKVYAKAALLQLNNISILYTGGKLDETALHFVL
jgi:hypothetical protein